MAWSVESKQFVVFHLPTENYDAYQVWLEIFGSSAETYQKKPDPAAPGSMASGNHAGFNFQVQCTPGRIDLFLMPNSGPEKPFPEIENEAAADPLFRVTSERLAKSKSCMRLALVINLFEDFKSIQVANKHFAALCKQPYSYPAASDLFFGLNIRKQYTTDGFVINRLCRWTALVKQIFQLQIQNGQSSQSLPVEQPAVVFNIDINTVLRQTPFKMATVPTIISSLFAEQAQLREEGYEALDR